MQEGQEKNININIENRNHSCVLYIIKLIHIRIGFALINWDFSLCINYGHLQFSNRNISSAICLK